MNEEKNNIVVTIIDWIVKTLAKSLVSIFDGLKNAIDHANPSLFSLVATLLPFALPLPVAFMSSDSARKFFEWDPWAANVLGFGLEGLGLLAWVMLVDAILEVVNSENKKVSLVVVLYGVVALVYEAVLLFLNVILARLEGASSEYTIVLGLVCLLPALSAMVYGQHRQHTEQLLAREKQEAKDHAEKLRQERRTDRKETQRLKLGYAADTEGVRLENADSKSFRGKSKRVA